MSHPLAPAPWTTKGEMYWLLTSLPKPLSPSIYNPLESRSTGDYKGGFAYIQIIRYTETPVGPYDELMILPGDFEVPESAKGTELKGKKKLRITRIYVSQKDTIYNGTPPPLPHTLFCLFSVFFREEELEYPQASRSLLFLGSCNTSWFLSA